MTDTDGSVQRLRESTSRLHTAVQWFADPSFSLRSWGARILIAGIVCQLLVSIMTLAWSKQVLDQLERDRAVRTDRTCLILTKLDATTAEKRDAGCP